MTYYVQNTSIMYVKTIRESGIIFNIIYYSFYVIYLILISASYKYLIKRRIWSQSPEAFVFKKRWKNNNTLGYISMIRLYISMIRLYIKLQPYSGQFGEIIFKERQSKPGKSRIGCTQK